MADDLEAPRERLRTLPNDGGGLERTEGRALDRGAAGANADAPAGRLSDRIMLHEAGLTADFGGLPCEGSRAKHCPCPVAEEGLPESPRLR